MTSHEQARDALGKCKSLINRIEARGGPVPGTEQRYARVKSWVEGHLTMLEDAELGIVPLVAGLWALVAMATAMGAYLSWQVKNQMVNTTGDLIDTAATIGKVTMWGGLVWLGWQALQTGRRRSA